MVKALELLNLLLQGKRVMLGQELVPMGKLISVFELCLGLFFSVISNHICTFTFAMAETTSP